MGLFDTIICEYPLPESDYLQQKDFQTKSLGSTLTEFKITPEGRLFREVTEQQEIPKDERRPSDNLWGAPTHKTVRIGWVDHNYHGDMNFYTTIDDKDDSSKRWWIEFQARFTWGQLDYIIPITPKELPKYTWLNHNEEDKP